MPKHLTDCGEDGEREYLLMKLKVIMSIKGIPFVP